MNQHVPLRPHLPVRSDLAAPDFAWERFADIARELAPLFKQHWREIALNQDRVALDPDWERYHQYDVLDMLHVLTARVGGALVGYALVLIGPHLHYASTRFAEVDIQWLSPVERRGWAGVEMIRRVELGAKERGAQVLVQRSRATFETGRGGVDKVFKRLGYKRTDVVYTKWIGD